MTLDDLVHTAAAHLNTTPVAALHRLLMDGEAHVYPLAIAAWSNATGTPPTALARRVEELAGYPRGRLKSTFWRWSTLRLTPSGWAAKAVPSPVYRALLAPELERVLLLQVNDH